MWILYKTTNKVNNKIYVGIHKTFDENDGYMGSGYTFKRALKKYGREVFTTQVLMKFDSEEEAYNIESILVDDIFCNRPDVYNIANGGHGGKIYKTHPRGMAGKNHSDELKINYSNRMKEYYKTNKPYERTEEIRKKISKTKTGKPSKMKGKTISEQGRINMRKPKKEMVCDVCGLLGRGGNMIRYHFKNCKENINVSIQ